jgi:hypothetical protein
MKTTVDIADPILRQAKRLASQRGTTLKVVIEDALRDALAKGAATRKRPVRTHVVEGRGLKSGLSWDDLASLRDGAYEGRGG